MSAQLYYKCKVTQSDGKGRVKCKYIALELLGYDVFTPWMQCMTGFYGQGKEGEHSKAGVNDIVVISFYDFPKNQHPFVLGKLQKDDDRFDVDTETILMFNDHKITFDTDEIVIEHEKGTKVTIEDNKIEFENSTSLSSIKYNDLDLILWLKTLLGPPSTILGNLGYPVLETTQIALLTAAITKALTVKKVTFE